MRKLRYVSRYKEPVEEQRLKKLDGDREHTSNYLSLTTAENTRGCKSVVGSFLFSSSSF